MNIAQYIARTKNRKILSPLRDEQIRLIEKMEMDKEAIKIMVQSSGWIAVKEYIQKDRELLSSSLERINPSDIDSVRKIQAEIKAYDRLMMFIENLVG